MIRKNLYLFAGIWIFSTQLQASLINVPYQVLLGNKDAASIYKDSVIQALKDFNVAHPENVPVKQMNSIAQKFIGSQLYTFTLFGIWLNEELLAQESKEIQEYRIYHEAAHYALGHHGKALGSIGLAIPVVAAIPVVYKEYASSLNISDQLSSWISRLLTAGISYGVYKEIFKRSIKEQEKEADLAAIRLLCSLGKESIVHAYLQELNSLITQGFADSTDGWHYTVQEQYEYCLTCFIFNHPNTTQALFNFQQG